MPRILEYVGESGANSGRNGWKRKGKDEKASESLNGGNTLRMRQCASLDKKKEREKERLTFLSGLARALLLVSVEWNGGERERDWLEMMKEPAILYLACPFSSSSPRRFILARVKARPRRHLVRKVSRISRNFQTSELEIFPIGRSSGAPFVDSQEVTDQRTGSW